MYTVDDWVLTHLGSNNFFYIDIIEETYKIIVNPKNGMEL
jgi:hypothetical protein